MAVAAETPAARLARLFVEVTNERYDRDPAGYFVAVFEDGNVLLDGADDLTAIMEEALKRL